MASIIVTGTGAARTAITNTISALNTTGIGNAILIAAENQLGSGLTGHFISSADSTLGACLTQALNHTSEKQLILLDASTEISQERMGALLNSLASIRGESFGYATLEQAGEKFDLPDLTVDSLVEFLSAGEKLPLLCCTFPRSLIENLDLKESLNSIECMTQVIVAAVASGMPLVSSSAAVRLPEQYNTNNLRLSPAAAGRPLRLTLDLCNIEDLFPGHPWSSHQSESAAASYHSLAAIFIRYGDFELANRCLSLGDTFEDSPRSLALKGFIAKERGEILGAVANMISSLQQYELRKKNENGEHYLTFKPLDLEVINTSMRDGLSALNKRDNSAALTCFTEAIINFDSFYKQFGIDSTLRN